MQERWRKRKKSVLLSWLTVLILAALNASNILLCSQVSFLRTLQRASSPIKPTFSLFRGPCQDRESIKMAVMVAARKEDAIVRESREPVSLPFF